jgi:hypothetical protein
VTKKAIDIANNRLEAMAAARAEAVRNVKHESVDSFIARGGAIEVLPPCGNGHPGEAIRCTHYRGGIA